MHGWPPHELADRVLSGERAALSRAITLVESSRPQDLDRAEAMLSRIGERPQGRSLRIGVTGPPGAGKSTFIEALGCILIGEGRRVAVLAVDPSSVASGGSILGDKTRMSTLSMRDEAYVRPSPAGGTLGGVALRTHDAITLCEAAGHDHVLIETVGVGQSEVEVDNMVDVMLLLLPPAAGDGLQAIKRGLVELADIVVVTKADGDLLPAARSIAKEFASALSLVRPRSSSWQPRVLTCSNRCDQSVGSVLAVLREFQRAAQASGEHARRREQQRLKLLWSGVLGELESRLRHSAHVQQLVRAQHAQMAAGAGSARVAAGEIVRSLLARIEAPRGAGETAHNDEEADSGRR